MRNELDEGELRGPRKWVEQARVKWQEFFDSSALLRQLIHEPLFLVAVVAVVACGGGVAILLPKVWTTSPPNFSKTVRISALDLLQAWNLRRTARKASTEGRLDDAVTAWRAALANNMADVSSHRGALTFLLDAPRVHSGELGLAFFCRNLLLELTGTNRSDALLVARVMQRYRVPEVALESLRPWEKELTPQEEEVWMCASLTGGRAADFEARWRAGHERFSTNALLRLYRAAYDATGPPATAVEAMKVLRAGVETPVHQLEAARMLCLAALRRDELEDYERGLQALRALDSSMVTDDAGWWGLLARHDRLDEAKRLALAYDRVPPPTPFEAVQLVRIWTDLGLADHALAMLKEHAERYGTAFEVWGAYFDLLVQRRDWTELRRVAASLRSSATERDDVLAITWYAEALADLSEDRRTSARDRLSRLSTATLPNPTVTFRLAVGLMKAREYDTSHDLLRRIEPDLSAAPEYWIQVIANAQNRKDLKDMKRATDQLLGIQPDSSAGLSIRLGLLLLARDSPSEALTLSLRLINAGMNSTAMRINHATALLQNHRVKEAKGTLDRIEPDRLTPVERAAWQAAQVDCLAQEDRFSEAVEMGKRVDMSQLMAPDAEWLRALIANCRRRAGAGVR